MTSSAEEFSSRFQIRPHREFIPEKGRGRLLSLNIFDQPPLEASLSSNEEEPKNAYDFMRSRKKLQGEDPAMKRWKASIRAQNYAKLVAPLSMAAIGALLDHLVRIHAAGDLEDQGISGLDVVGIELLALDQVMQIDTDALTSLQVFCDQNHASVHSNRTKEGLSLFGILDKTRTSLGRALLRQWLLRPSLDIPVILARYDAVECFSSSDNLDVADAIRTHLGGLKNLPRTLGFLRSGKGSLRDWASFVKATFHACLLRETVCDLSSTTLVPIVQKLLDVLDTNTLKTIGSGVNETIDWEMSQNEERVCVRHLVDPELDEKKRIYNSLSIFLSEVALKVAEGIPPDKREYAKLLNVLYFPQLGKSPAFLVGDP
ncbi:MutS protein msh5 [Tulasnella sp. 418]|nr:MutS protein msh5 [Tulasnella sp. 418]